MHIAPPPSGFFLKTMYMATRGQGAFRLTKVAGSGEGRALPSMLPDFFRCRELRGSVSVVSAGRGGHEGYAK